jgi:hypothetical protein
MMSFHPLSTNVKKEFCFEVTAMACVVNSTSKGKRRVSQKIFLVPQVK